MVATADDDLRATAKTSVLVSAPALELRLGPRPRFVVGEEIDYRLELSNPGTAPATHIRLTNTLPGELDFVSASAGGTYDPARREVTWLLPSLPPGGSEFFAVKLIGETPGDFLHEVTARADRNLLSTAQGEISYEIDDKGSSDILEKVVALMDGADDTASRSADSSKKARRPGSLLGRPDPG